MQVAVWVTLACLVCAFSETSEISLTTSSSASSGVQVELHPNANTCEVGGESASFTELANLSPGDRSIKYVFDVPTDGCYLVEESHQPPTDLEVCGRKSVPDVHVTIGYCKGKTQDVVVNQTKSGHVMRAVALLPFYVAEQGYIEQVVPAGYSSACSAGASSCVWSAGDYTVTYWHDKCNTEAWNMLNQAIAEEKRYSKDSEGPSPRSQDSPPVVIDLKVPYAGASTPGVEVGLFGATKTCRNGGSSGQHYIDLDDLKPDDKSLTYSFDIPQPGCYVVEHLHPSVEACYHKSTPDVPLEIHYCKGGIFRTTVDQTRSDDVMRVVGMFPFFAGYPGKVIQGVPTGVCEKPNYGNCVVTTDQYRLTWWSSKCDDEARTKLNEAVSSGRFRASSWEPSAVQEPVAPPNPSPSVSEPAAPTNPPTSAPEPAAEDEGAADDSIAEAASEEEVVDEPKPNEDPEVDSEAVAEGEDASDLPTDIHDATKAARLEIRIVTDFDAIKSKLNSMKTEMIQLLADVSGISSQRLSIQSFRKGSVIAEVMVAPPVDDNEISAMAVAMRLRDDVSLPDVAGKLCEMTGGADDCAVSVISTGYANSPEQSPKDAQKEDDRAGDLWMYIVWPVLGVIALTITICISRACSKSRGVDANPAEAQDNLEEPPVADAKVVKGEASFDDVNDGASTATPDLADMDREVLSETRSENSFKDGGKQETTAVAFIPSSSRGETLTNTNVTREEDVEVSMV